MSCNCFAAGTPVWTPQGQVPIERLELGQRVLTFTDAERLRFGWPPETPIDPGTWRVVRASIDHGDGYTVEVALLRGPEWIRRHGPEPGGTIFLTMPEMGAEGNATVLAVEECPTIEAGDGRVITSLFRHSRGRPRTLHIAGCDEAAPSDAAASVLVCEQGYLGFGATTSGR